MIAPGRTASVANAAAAVRVMVCDDSAVIRGAVARMLEAEPSVQVVARVANGQLALDELKRTQVDVLVLDIEMPVMDGMTALPLLLRADPGLKVIMASTLTTRGADIAHEIQWYRTMRAGEPTRISGRIADKYIKRGLHYISWETHCVSMSKEPIFDVKQTVLDISEGGVHENRSL